MSLIQEALKRKDDEDSGIPPKAIPVVSPGARRSAVKQPEVPVASFMPPVKQKTSQGWPVLVISLLVVTVLALAAVGLLLWSLTQVGQQARVTNVTMESPASQTVVPEPVLPKVEPVVAVASNPVPVAPGPVLKPVEPVVEATPAVAAKAPAPGESVVFSISTGIVKEGTIEKKPARAEVSIVPVARPVVSQSSWPALKVVGVMAPRSATQAGAAIIDGNLVECGDEIRGVKVQSVNKSGVWFEFRSQTQFVRVGQSTL